MVGEEGCWVLAGQLTVGKAVIDALLGFGRAKMMFGENLGAEMESDGGRGKDFPKNVYHVKGTFIPEGNLHQTMENKKYCRKFFPSDVRWDEHLNKIVQGGVANPAYDPAFAVLPQQQPALFEVCLDLGVEPAPLCGTREGRSLETARLTRRVVARWKYSRRSAPKRSLK